MRIPASQPCADDQVWLQVWRSGGRSIELKVSSRLTEFYHVKFRILIPCRACFSGSASSPGYFDLLQMKNLVLASHTEASCQPDGLHRC